MDVFECYMQKLRREGKLFYNYCVVKIIIIVLSKGVSHRHLTYSCLLNDVEIEDDNLYFGGSKPKGNTI